MKSHELAKILLKSDDAAIECSVDISTCEKDSERRAFGSFVEVVQLPSDLGFGADSAVLLFGGSLNET